MDSGNSVTSNKPKEIAPGATLTLPPTQERRSGLGAVVARVFQFIITVAGPMAINPMSNYLYDRLKDREDFIKTEIGRRTIEVD
ncbi:MAG: hypothetical protein ABSE36_15485 [Terracidiphilus sp.]|jgi:hypothetical protein